MDWAAAVRAPETADKLDPVSEQSSHTMLAPGHEAEWAALNREEAEQLRASNMALSPTQRLDQGQRLSRQAVSLLAASIRAGHAPRRAFWS
jgi:mannose/cellobiose epimerase-like protein (N-acyl-D-glucosamine 2-epimerase family)